MPIFLLKLCLVPALIFGVTLAGRRWGPEVAGWLSAFPIVSGPILLAISLEQGALFGAHAAQGTLLAVIAILVFSVAYAFAARRFDMPGAMACALLAYACAVAGLQSLSLPVGASFAAVWIALAVAPRLFPPSETMTATTKPEVNDLPWRMLAAVLLVLAVTLSAPRIGPRLSGFLAMFPVMSTVLVGFSHVHAGRAFAVAMLRGMVAGYFAFSMFCLVLSLMLERGAIAPAFLAAFACALTVQVATRRLLASRTAPR